MMLSEGMVEAGVEQPSTVSAYVVYLAGRGSRVFKVKEDSSAPGVTELEAATTFAVKRLQSELVKKTDGLDVT
jgi:hypothetical protein